MFLRCSYVQNIKSKIRVSKNRGALVTTIFEMQKWKNGTSVNLINWVYNFWCWYLNVLTTFLLFFQKKDETSKFSC